MLKRCLLLLILLLAACGTQETPDADLNNSRLQPTVSPPPWVEAGDSISLDNAPRIEYLGRLDANTTPSTIFNHAFSPDATRLAALNNDQVMAWDMISGTMVFGTARGQATRVYYSPDKTEVYTLDETGKFNVHDADTGVFQTGIQGHPAYGGYAAYDGEAGLLALGGLNGEVKIWDMLERSSLVTFRAQELRVNYLVFSPDGEQLATSGDEGTATVWNWRDKTPIAMLDPEPENIVVLAFSPDGTQLAVGTTLDITLWSIPGGELQHTLDIPVGGASEILRYSPDGSYLLSAGRTTEASLWNPQTGELAAVLPGVGDERTTAAFSPDGALLVTSVLGGQVSLWDLTRVTEETVNQAPINAGNQIYAADWSSDGRVIALFDAGGAVHLWGIAGAAPVTPTPAS
jgi:WD40 repeat protein